MCALVNSYSGLKPVQSCAPGNSQRMLDTGGEHFAAGQFPPYLLHQEGSSACKPVPLCILEGKLPVHTFLSLHQPRVKLTLKFLYEVKNENQKVKCLNSICVQMI